MNPTAFRTILVPGAWMGEWIWEPVCKQLSGRGIPAETLTLAGLEANTDPQKIAAVTLNDHVPQLANLVLQSQVPVVLVGHSYSSMITGQVADQMPERVAGLVHFGGFLPSNGRSLMDDWGDAENERNAERADIEEAGNLWMPPTEEMLAYEPDIQAKDRAFLAENFTPHPGSTVTDRAVMKSPIEAQPTTYIAMSAESEDAAWKDAPEIAREARGWRRLYIQSGHWPMVSNPDATLALIEQEVLHYSSSQGSQIEAHPQ